MTLTYLAYVAKMTKDKKKKRNKEKGKKKKIWVKRMTVTYPPEADIGSLPPSPQDMKFVTIYCLDTTVPLLLFAISFFSLSNFKVTCVKAIVKIL